MAAYNSRIVSSNTTSGVTTFEVTDSRFVLEKEENSVINIMFLADALNNPDMVRYKTGLIQFPIHALQSENGVP